MGVNVDTKKRKEKRMKIEEVMLMGKSSGPHPRLLHPRHAKGFRIHRRLSPFPRLKDAREDGLRRRGNIPDHGYLLHR